MISNFKNFVKQLVEIHHRLERRCFLSVFYGKITGEKTYEDAYIFYSEKKKSIMYSIQRKNFALESEFDVEMKFVNFKENKTFINNKSLKHFNKHGKNEKLHTVFIDEDDYINNKDFIDKIYNKEAI